MLFDMNKIQFQVRLSFVMTINKSQLFKVNYLLVFQSIIAFEKYVPGLSKNKRLFCISGKKRFYFFSLYFLEPQSPYNYYKVVKDDTELFPLAFPVRIQ